MRGNINTVVATDESSESKKKSTVLAIYEPADLKKKLRVVNMQLHWYNKQDEKRKAEIFKTVENDPDREMIRRLEKYHGVTVVGVAECSKSLHLRIYNPSTNQVLNDGIKINGSQTSTTVQYLGMSIADVVMERARQPQYKIHISDEIINIAARTKTTLGRKVA